MYYRNLFKIEVYDNEIDESYIRKKQSEFILSMHLSQSEVDYFVSHGKMENRAYNKALPSIHILDKNNNLHTLETLSDHLNHRTLSESVSKYFYVIRKINRKNIIVEVGCFDSFPSSLSVKFLKLLIKVCANSLACCS